MSPTAYGDVRWSPDPSELGAHDAILSESGPEQLGPFSGALSIKRMLSGVAVWSAGGRRFRVEGSAFLVLNHGTVCTLERRALRASGVQLLDAPDSTPNGVVTLRERLCAGDERVVPRLRALAGAIRSGAATPLGVESAFFELASALVLTQDGVAAESARAPIHARVVRL